jgi:hypothetical protein
MVDETVNGGEVISLASYARHRNISTAAVSKAVKRGRLVESVSWVDGVPKIGNVAAADAEWTAKTNYQRCPARSASSTPGRKWIPVGELRPSVRFAVCRSRRGSIILVSLESEAVHDVDPVDNFVDGAFTATDPESALKANQARFPEDELLFSEMTPDTARALAAALIGACK